MCLFSGQSAGGSPAATETGRVASKTSNYTKVIGAQEIRTAKRRQFCIVMLRIVMASGFTDPPVVVVR